jgi:hypothetical protein
MEATVFRHSLMQFSKLSFPLRKAESTTMGTRSEAYFLQLLGSATLRGAAEAAALSELSAVGQTAIPVDVYRVASNKGFTVLEDLAGSGCEEGQLLPVSGGYRVRLRRGVTDARKRFSLAHEIGHSYFYRDEGEGPRHVIGVLSAAERGAEENICNLFAGALLMPAAALRKNLQKLAVDSSPLIISVLERVATSFKVSMPALLRRIGSLELDWPPCLFVCSSFRPNPKTGLQPKLRIEFSLGLGAWSNRRFWSGTPVADANISSAIHLYDMWVAAKPDPEAGQFVVVGTSLDHNAVPPKHPEAGIVMSRNSMGLWKREAVQCISSSALYTWKHGGSQPSAYVLTVVTP